MLQQLPGNLKPKLEEGDEVCGITYPHPFYGIGCPVFGDPKNPVYKTALGKSLVPTLAPKQQ